ncbi:MAG: DNA internalization-related competence protein ComEC/Rec2, partial [Thermodesulfobacteriota bacterium]|nr:DNA internalization-related competence protein ComEC/Rec2 [Thermodesulfobacteriota bacterium]
GITVGNLIYIPNLPVMIFLFISLLVLLPATIKKQKNLTMGCLFTSLFFLGILNINLCLHPDPTPMNIYNYANSKEKITIEGVICKNPLTSPDRTNLIVAVTKIIKDGAITPVEGKMLLSVRNGGWLYKYGDLIRAKTRLKIPHNFNNPGGFDYKKYLEYRNIRVRGFINNPSGIVVIRENRGNSLKIKLEKFRSSLRNLIEETSPYPEGKVLQALILGERKEIPKDVLENFNRAGISHVLAISGLHIGIIAFFSIIIVRFIMKSSEYLLLRFNIVKVSAFFAFIPIITYAFIAGFGISTVRATIMILTFLIAILFGKERELFNTLALAAFVILVVSPASLFDISFQLSFTAVAAILFIAPGLTSLIPKGGMDETDKIRYYRKILLFIIVSISATLGTAPLIAFYFNRISTVILFSNILIIPIIGFVVLPLGMATIVTTPISASLATLFIKISSFFVGISISIVKFLATLPLSSFFVTTPTLIEITAYYLLLITTVKLIDVRKGTITLNPPLQKGCMGGFMGLKIAFVLLILFFIGDGIYLYTKDTTAGHLKTTFIDVGQGSSTLLEFPGGTKMLVDGGGFYSKSFDVGRYVVAPFLWHERIKKVDIVVLTHPQLDHLNGLIYILKNFDVREVWSNGETAHTKTYRKFIKIIKEKHITRRIVSQDTPEKRIGEVIIRILNPENPITKEDSSVRFDIVNNNSLVMKLTFGKVVFLLPADISEPTESRLVMNGVHLKSDVLMAPHHGGFTSSTPPFLKKVHPEIVVFSCGVDNVFRDPHPDVLERYRTIDSKIFRTDRNGAVTIITDGENILTRVFKRDRFSPLRSRRTQR